MTRSIATRTPRAGFATLAIGRLFAGALCAALLLGGSGAAAREESIGAYEFRQACAPCHGVEGLGDGPVAQYLNTPPADLTKLARDFGGAFPTLLVRQLVDGRLTDRVHGDADMPVWGDRFMLEEDRGAEPEFAEAVIRERIRAVVAYLERIQQP